MLDDLKLIHERDAQDALGIAEKQWQQLEHQYEFPAQSYDVENIVFSGMGGSALAALLSRTWPDYKIPFVISRDYGIPGYTSKKTLFIVSSYSGNTEEALSSLEKAKKAGAHIVVISADGKLKDIAEQNNYPFILLPKIGQPRFAVLSSFKALVTILEKAGLVEKDAAEKQISDAADFIKATTRNWRPDVATKDNVAKQIALEIVGKTAIIYGGPLMFPAAYKWKINLNENAKNTAWCGKYPEFSHNEFMGWTSHPLDKPFTVIELHSNLEHPRIQKRFKVTEKLLSGRRPAPIKVQAKGDTLLEQMLWMVALGDFVSIYTAILNGLNPTPIDLLEKFKTEMAM